MVTNFAAGISPTRLIHQEVVDAMIQNGENMRKLLMLAINGIEQDRACVCHNA
jgi:5'-methylthioadenosine phosphorylase